MKHGTSKWTNRLKLVPRQRPNFEGYWVEVQTARPASTNFLNATKFFVPFYTPDLMVVTIEEIE